MTLNSTWRSFEDVDAFSAAASLSLGASPPGLLLCVAPSEPVSAATTTGTKALMLENATEIRDAGGTSVRRAARDLLRANGRFAGDGSASISLVL